MESGATLDTDLCIIGTGPAGLTVASEFLHRSTQVMLVESGGIRPHSNTDLLSQLELVSSDFDSPNQTRRRGFGGMASLWDTALPDHRLGAKYVALDDIDFETRDWIPFSGWPFERSELAPYYARARALCGLGSVPPGLDVLARDGLTALPFKGETVITRLHELGPAHVFTVDLRRAIERSRNVTAVVHSTVTALEAEVDEMRVSVARIRCLRGSWFSVRARFFILAMGAIENARLLLLSGQGKANCFGNGFENVGRFFMDHQYILSGMLVPHDPRIFESARLYDVRSRRGESILGKLALSESTLRRESLLNSSVLLQPVLRPGYGHRQLRMLGTDGRSSNTRGRSRSLAALMGVAEAVSTGAQLAWRQRRIRPSPRYGSWSYLAGNRRRFGSFALVHQVEQAPHPENRVVLGSGTDAFGLRIPLLHWQWSELDIRSIERTRQILKAEFERSGIGVLDFEPRAMTAEFARLGLEVPNFRADSGSAWLLTRRGAHHHLGTTRMHRDSTQGVVDEQCKVHDISNAFVVGGSVFPTGGCANPTLTILALAVRLSDHIKAVLAA